MLVEYALVLTLLLLGSAGAIRFLETESADEVNQEADCMALRPPPPSCQPRAVTTTTTVVGTPTSSPTTTTVLPTASLTWEDTRSEPLEPVEDGLWDGITEPEITAPGEDGVDVPVAGATVRAEAVVIQPPPESPPFVLDCVTDETGRCELRLTTPYPGVTRVDLRNVEVIADGLVIETTPEPPDFTVPPGMGTP